MKISIWKSAALSTVFALSMPWIASADEATSETETDAATVEAMIAEDEYPVREDMVLVTLEATVEAIDYELRDVTLKGPGGNSFTVTADPQVNRLNEIEVGDKVSVSHLTSVAYELREPTAEEIAEPLIILDDVVRAPEDMAPGAAEISVIRAVCTIEGLDRQNMTAKLLGPLGGYNTVAIADPDNLPKLRIGDSVVVTYTEAVALVLEKVSDEDDEEEGEAPAEG